MAQKKNTSKFRKKLNNTLMSAFAVAMTLMPIFTVGVWVNQQFFYDNRKVSALSNLSAPTSVPRLFEEPLVSVTFDDGWESIYSDAAPILHAYDIRTTQFVLSGVFDNPRYLSKEQLLSLQEAGHEIGGHGESHADLTGISSEELYAELKVSQDSLKNAGVKGKMSFASPYGSSNDKTISQIRQYYSSQRNTQGDIRSLEPFDMNVGPTLDRYNIVGFTVRNDTTLQQMTDALKYAKEHKAWFVITYHQIDKSNGEYSVSPKVLESHIKLIREHKIKVVTIGDVVETLDD